MHFTEPVWLSRVCPRASTVATIFLTRYDVSPTFYSAYLILPWIPKRFISVTPALVASHVIRWQV